MAKKRNKQHIISSKSIKMLTNLFPDEWVLREFPNDYGIDYVVEIFENNETTGNMFFIQLKGTTKKLKKNGISFPIGKDTLDYYNTLILPVLMMVCHVDEQLIWCKWVNNVPLEGKGKSVSISFTDENLTSEDSFYSIADRFNINIKNNILLNLTGDSSDSLLYNEKLEKCILDKFSGKISGDNKLATQELKILTVKSPEGFVVVVEYLNLKFEVPISIDDDSVFLLTRYNHEVIDKELFDLLYTIGIIVLKNYVTESINVIKETFISYDGEMKTFDNIATIAQIMFANDKITDFQDLIHLTIANRKKTDFEMLNSLLLVQNNRSNLYSKLYGDNLLAYREILENSVELAINSYNLGNHYRSISDLYESVKYYCLAAKYDSDYKNRCYFWFELAGVLFETKHYKFSELFYKKSLKLDVIKLRGDIVYALIGDSLFRQKKFHESNQYFEMYIRKSKHIATEFLLTQLVIDKSFIGYDETVMNSDYLTISESDRSDLSPQEVEKMYREALNHNPLDGLAWFNLAHVLNLQSRGVETRDAYLNCAIIQREEEALQLACIHSLYLVINLIDTKEQISEYNILVLTIRLLIEKFGIASTDEVCKKILLDNKDDMDLVKKIIVIIQVLIDKILKDAK